MPSTSLGIRYPSPDSANLDGDIQDMMTDIDVRMKALQDRAESLRRVWGARCPTVTLVSSALVGTHTFSGAHWDTTSGPAIFNPGVPDRLTLTGGIWLVQADMLTYCAAGNINFASVTINMGIASTSMAQHQVGPITNTLANFSVSSVIRVPPAGEYIQMLRVAQSTSAGTNFTSYGHMSAHRLRDH
jgi:hypothetical protein